MMVPLLPLPLPHRPPPPPPSIMGAPLAGYKWPWKTATACPPARAPATSPVSPFPADLIWGKGRCPGLGWGLMLMRPSFPGLTLASGVPPRVAPAVVSPVWSFECPPDTEAPPQLPHPSLQPRKPPRLPGHSETPPVHPLPLSSHRAEWHGAAL